MPTGVCSLLIMNSKVDKTFVLQVLVNLTGEPEPLAQQVHRAGQVQREPQAPWALQAYPMEFLDPQAPQAPLAHRVLQVSQANEDHLGQPDHLDPLDQLTMVSIAGKMNHSLGNYREKPLSQKVAYTPT